jgi:histidinol-phosphate phosphatase family protein
VSGSRGAVFLDRDNTIVADPGFLHEAAKVELLPDAGAGLAALSAGGWPLVIISNQSGMARGLYGPEGWDAVMRRLQELLTPLGVRLLDAAYCPHHPDFTGPCDCRKPGVKLFRDAAMKHRIDLGESWFLGDRWTDVEPAATLGGRALLVNADPLSEDSRRASEGGIRTVPTLLEAARRIGRRA